MPTILIVEDEATILLLAQGVVEGAGNSTLTAGNGIQALALLDAETAIDLVFTDIALGDGPDGLEVATAARAKWPQLPVIYASGQTVTDGLQALMVEGSIFLKKPYSPEALQEAVEKALSKA